MKRQTQSSGLQSSPTHLQVSIWYGCVLRGDLNNVKVGAFSNVQDRTVIHAARWVLSSSGQVLPHCPHSLLDEQSFLSSTSKSVAHTVQPHQVLRIVLVEILQSMGPNTPHATPCCYSAGQPPRASLPPPGLDATSALGRGACSSQPTSRTRR